MTKKNVSNSQRHEIKNHLMAIIAYVATFELKHPKEKETHDLTSNVKERVEMVVKLLDEEK